MPDRDVVFLQDDQTFLVGNTLKRYYARLVQRGRAPRARDVANNFDGTHSITTHTYTDANIVRNKVLRFRRRLVEARTSGSGSTKP